MSSDYKGKNIFGADIYQGSDGIYHNKEDADRTYRSDYKRDNEYSQPAPMYKNPDNPYQSQPFSTPVSGGPHVGMSLVTKNRLVGMALGLIGTWVITWLLVGLQGGLHYPGVLFRFLYLVSFVFLWPGRLLAGLMAENVIPGFAPLYMALPLINFFWLCLLGKVVLKTGKLKKVFGLKAKGYKQLSWVKVAVMLLAVQLVLAAAAKL